MRNLPVRMALAKLTVLALVACGDDGERDSTTTTGNRQQSDQSVPTYCEANAKLDAQQEPPTAEQFQELADLAPPEIQEETEFVAERVAAEGLDAFDDPAVSDVASKLETWQTENCPGPHGN